MTKQLFAVLDRVQDGWPSGAGFLLLNPTPTTWSVEAAYQVVTGWSRQEYDFYRRQLPSLAAELVVLHQRWCVAAVLVVALAATIVVAGMPAALLSSTATGVLMGVLAAVVLPPVAICNGIARDCVAAQSLVAACAASQSSAR
jgi:hypothetical protein